MVGEMIAQWQTALRLLAENQNQISCIYEEKLRLVLETEPMRKLWSEHWRIPEFVEYRDLKWVELLMPFATKDYFVVLGEADCLPELLHRHAGRMRGVKWVLERWQDTSGLQDFLDDFYEDTGIAVTVEFIGGEAADETKRQAVWRRFLLSAPFPVNVIDFSGKTRYRRVLCRGGVSGLTWTLRRKKRNILWREIRRFFTFL